MTLPANIPPARDAPVNRHVAQIQQKSPISRLPGVTHAVCSGLCRPRGVPGAGRPDPRAPGRAEAQLSSICRQAAEAFTPPRRPGARACPAAARPGCGPGVNHTSLKSHRGPFFLLESTPGAALESQGDRPRLLCSALHKIAISRLTSLMSKLVASDGGK